MDKEDLNFDMSPEVEDLDIENTEEVYELLEDEEIGLPGEYGYSDVEVFVEDIFRRVIGEQQYNILQDAESFKWEEFIDEYKEAGGVLYNPDNGDEYYTDKTGLSAEDIR